MVPLGYNELIPRRLRDYGDIYMKEDVGPGKYTFQVSVNDPRWSQVVSTVNVDVIALNDSAVENSGSIRLQGECRDSFQYKDCLSLYENYHYKDNRASCKTACG